MEQRPDQVPHPASVARFARKGPAWAHWRYAVCYLAAFAVLAVNLAATDRGSAERWTGCVVFAVILAAALFVNARALRSRGDR